MAAPMINSKKILRNHSKIRSQLYGRLIMTAFLNDICRTACMNVVFHWSCRLSSIIVYGVLNLEQTVWYCLEPYLQIVFGHTSQQKESRIPDRQTRVSGIQNDINGRGRRAPIECSSILVQTNAPPSGKADGSKTNTRWTGIYLTDTECSEFHVMRVQWDLKNNPDHVKIRITRRECIGFVRFDQKFVRITR